MELDDEPANLEEDVDLCYPYREGPGHPASTPEALVILWKMMCDSGMTSFLPDFTQPFDSPDNECLLDFSVETFFELVQCNEYAGINMQDFSKESIQNTIYLHVTQRLRRR
ncbi:hypothetical protein O181_102133 [Austropuccinia psidii MF-1]|uniref:Uncharacterized protein n=1 Tax=Austropuccinia psidii MF-1 TaxID=1389203 RepID=A0A9Q3JFT4_9BASI|nr:hypothetical protein [Austropuccinia psidii MF-1]